MNILLTGAHGFLGQNLGLFLKQKGHSLMICQTSKKPLPFPNRAWFWSDLPQALEKAEAIIHLAGSSFQKLDLPLNRQKVWKSRIQSSERLIQGCQKLTRPPQTIISVSGVHVYDSPEEPQRENSPKSQTFLGRLCQAWEQPFLQAPTRWVGLRLGVVLDPRGGLLKNWLRFWSAGCQLEGHSQWNWISLRDLFTTIEMALETPTCEGPLNVVASDRFSFSQLSEGFPQTSLKCPLSSLKALPLLSRHLLAPTFASGEKLNSFLSLQDTSFPLYLKNLKKQFPPLFQTNQFFFTHQQWLKAPPSQVLPFLQNPHNLAQFPLPIPFLSVRVFTEKQTFLILLKLGPLILLKWKGWWEKKGKQTWRDYQDDQSFLQWTHEHEVRNLEGSLSIDRAFFRLKGKKAHLFFGWIFALFFQFYFRKRKAFLKEHFDKD